MNMKDFDELKTAVEIAEEDFKNFAFYAYGSLGELVKMDNPVIAEHLIERVNHLYEVGRERYLAMTSARKDLEECCEREAMLSTYED